MVAAGTYRLLVSSAEDSESVSNESASLPIATATDTYVPFQQFRESSPPPGGGGLPLPGDKPRR